MKNKFNENFYNLVIKLNKENITAKDIALKLNCSRKTILRFLKKEGLNYTSNYKPKEYTCLFCNRLTKNPKFCNRSCHVTYHNHLKLSSERINFLEKKKELYIKYKDYKGTERVKKVAEDKLLSEDFNNISSLERKRKRILLEQNNKCNKCSLSEWLGKPLTLELEHIDGNNKNNKRENLECLCPNCHSLTNTWRGKNRKDKKLYKTITIEDFKDAYLKCNNIRKALISLDLSPKGNNYSRMYKALDSYDIFYKRQGGIV